MGTQEEIQARINSRLTNPANKLEGGFSQDIIGSVSYELANIKDTEIDAIPDRAFVETAQGDDLDKVGEDYGIPRRKDANAIVFLEITGEKGAIVNGSIKAVYENLIYTVQETKEIDDTGIVLVKAQCETKGTIGNAPANTINKFLTNYAGLISVNNPEAAYDGFDKESDEIYRKRIKDYLASDASNANKEQYEAWARSITGVDKAIVKAADEGAGAGNVAIYISAIEQTVSSELRQAVFDYIDYIQPINATVIVNSMNYKKIDITAKVVLKEEYTKDNIKSELEAALKPYLRSAQEVVSYFKISDLIFACVGVVDVLEFTLNGGTASIEIADIDNPVIGTITITEGLK